MNNSSKYLQTTGIFIVGFLSATLLQLRGSLLPEIQMAFGVTERLLGLIAPAGSIGFTISVLIAGVVVGRVNGNQLLQYGTFMTAVASIVLGFSPLFLFLLSMVALRSFATGLFRGLDRPALNHLFPRARGKFYSFYSACWSLGGAVGPLYANFIMNYFGNWRITYILIGIALMPAVVILYNTNTNRIFNKEKILNKEKARELIKNPAIIAMMVALILDVSVEGSIFTWLPYYMNQFFSRQVANFALAGYLSCYIPGAIINGFIVNRISKVKIIVASSIGTIALLAIAFFTSSNYIRLFCFVSSGLFISPNFPNLIALGTDAYPRHSGPTNSLAMISYALGLSVLPPIIGLFAEQSTLRIGMGILPLPLVGMIIIVLFYETPFFCRRNLYRFLES